MGSAGHRDQQGTGISENGVSGDARNGVSGAAGNGVSGAAGNGVSGDALTGRRSFLAPPSAPRSDIPLTVSKEFDFGRDLRITA
jgi:hypothetical protein